MNGAPACFWPCFLAWPRAGSLAAACSNVATGNWGTAGTWAAPCNVAGGPTAADTVTIINNTTVTVNGARAASSVTIATGANASRLTFAAGASLAVTNDVVVNLPTGAVAKQITVATGTLTVGGNVTLNGGTAATRDALLTVSTGLITINGGLIIKPPWPLHPPRPSRPPRKNHGERGRGRRPTVSRVRSGQGTFSVTNAAATFNNTSATNVASTTVSSGQLIVAGALTNGAAETITVSTTGSVTAGGTLTNNGTMTLSSTGTVTASGTFANGATGTMTAGPGTVNAVTFTNANVVTVSTGLINVTGNYTNTAVGDTVTISNVAGRLTVGGTLTNGGTVTAATGTVNAGTFTNDNVVTVSSGLINVTGNYTNTAVGDTVTISNAAGRLTVGCQQLTNGGTVAAATGTVNAGTFTNNNVVTVSTGLINVTGAYTNTAVGDTVTISGAGGRLTVGGTLTNNGTVTLTTTGIVNANGDFTNGATGVFTNTAAGILNIGGNATINGTFNRGTGTLTFNGAAPQTLSSTAAKTYNNLTISKPGAGTVSITCATPSPTVNATLALTSGRIVTPGTSPGCSTACSAQVPISSRRPAPSRAAAARATCRERCASFSAPAATLNLPCRRRPGRISRGRRVELHAGRNHRGHHEHRRNITACVTPADHPQVTTPVATTGIDAAKSVNRYWSLTTSTINTGAGLVNAIFKFVAGDVDEVRRPETSSSKTGTGQPGVRPRWSQQMRPAPRPATSISPRRPTISQSASRCPQLLSRAWVGTTRSRHRRPPDRYSASFRPRSQESGSAWISCTSTRPGRVSWQGR